MNIHGTSIQIDILTEDKYMYNVWQTVIDAQSACICNRHTSLVFLNKESK